MLDHPRIVAVSLVRRLDADRELHQCDAPQLAGKRVQALGGARTIAVVMPDADLDFKPLTRLIGAAYGSAGERCMAISVVVAVGNAGDALVEG